MAAVAAEVAAEVAAAATPLCHAELATLKLGFGGFFFHRQLHLLALSVLTLVQAHYVTLHVNTTSE